MSHAKTLSAVFGAALALGAGGCSKAAADKPPETALTEKPLVGTDDQSRLDLHLSGINQLQKQIMAAEMPNHELVREKPTPNTDQTEKLRFISWV